MSGLPGGVPNDTTIELYSGEFFDLAAPDPAKIDLESIAHGLSMTCRFGGQTRRFYSVAEHACLVAYRLRETGASLETQLAGLHHDDAEAFIGDNTQPMKRVIPQLRWHEGRVFETIEKALDLPAGDHLAVKEVDEWALSAEAYMLLPSRGAAWYCAGYFNPTRDKLLWTLGWEPALAKACWLDWHMDLVHSV